MDTTKKEQTSARREITAFRHDLYLRVIKLTGLMLLVCTFAWTWYTFYAENVYLSGFYRRGNWAIIILYSVLLFLFGRTYEAYQISLQSISDIVFSHTLACLVTNAIFYILMWILFRRLPNLFPIFFCFAIQLLLATGWAVFAHNWYYRVFPRNKAIVIYDKYRGKSNLIKKYGYDKKYDVIGAYQVRDFLANRKIGTESSNISQISSGRSTEQAVAGAGTAARNRKTVDAALRTLDRADCVFMVDLHSHDRNIIVKYCVDHDIDAFIQPRIGDLIMNSAQPLHLFYLPILKTSRYHPTPEYLFVKRAFDIVSAGILLVLISPVYLVTALAIHLYDRGPVHYKQVRLTKDGREFKVLKFRSMRVDAEKDGVARLSSGEADPRITPVGRIIRRFRIDEVPQLINIIRGDMSVVGPRPERPEIAAQYEKELPEFRLRLQAKAGLTGYAQVFGKYNTEPYDKLGLDLMYIANASITMDLRIIFATIKILFLPESTEGIEEGQTTAMGQDLQEEGIRTKAS